MMLNKNKKAVESFEKAIQIDKNYDTAYYQKGIAEEKNRRHATSIYKF